MKRLALLVLVLVGGCDLVDVLTNPETWQSYRIVGANRITPAPSFADAWADVSVCAGSDKDFDRIQWYRAEAIEQDGREWRSAHEPPDRIYLAEYTLSDPAATTSAVYHELAHYARDDRTNEAHSDPAFWTCATP